MTSKRAFFGCVAGHEFVVQLDTGATIVDGGRCREPGCRARATYSRVVYEPAGGWNDGADDSAAPYAFVKGRDYQFDKQFEVMPQGRHYGVPDHVHEAAHRRRDAMFATESRRFRRGHSAKKASAPQYLGSIPAEVVHQIGMQERDPAAVTKDPIGFLKRTGRYVGD